MDRNQIDKKYKWGIESIYSDSSLIKEDMDKALSLIDEIIKYKDVELNENFLYEMISLEMSINRILEKL